MQFSRRMGRLGNVDVLKCDDLSASHVVSLRNKVNRLMNRKHYRVIVDLWSAKKMDAAGIGILVEKLLRLREHKGDIRLCRLRPEVSRMMEKVGVGTLFETYPTKEEALNSFREN